MSISAGDLFEDQVTDIYRAAGFEVERKKRIDYNNEIDVVAKKGSRVIAVECKNTPGMNNGKLKECIALLILKANMIKASLRVFVLNASIKDDMRSFAKEQKVTLVNIGELRNLVVQQLKKHTVAPVEEKVKISESKETPSKPKPKKMPKKHNSALCSPFLGGCSCPCHRCKEECW